MGPAGETGAQGGDGRIPFTFRIGVTGHRKLDKADDLRQPIRKAIARLLTHVPVAPGAGLALVVVSALAEGADRLVAEEVLAAGDDQLVLKDVLAAADDQEMVLKTVLADLDARLEVALPMDAEKYAEDFESEDSKQEFRCLLARARPGDIWTAPDSPDRDEAYERAGRYVVDRCDAIIAVWDGEKSKGRGGTEEIVGYAQEKGVPIAWVHTEDSAGPSYAHSYEQDSRTEVVRKAADKLRMYNKGVIASGDFDKRMQELRKELMPDVAREIPIDPLGLSRDTVADWVFPYFVRADILALRYQWRFRWLSVAIFVLAAAAVAVVALQATIWPAQNWVVVFEAACLVGLLLILGMNRRWRLHDQWISSRFLAERLRSSYFLALAGTGDQRGRSARLTYLSDSSEAWIERALSEVIARRPLLDAGSAPVPALRGYLKRYWIESQIFYQKKASGKHRMFDEWLVRGTELLFLLTLIAALVHSVGSYVFNVPENWEKTLLVFSITVPAVGAAIHGIGTQRQFRRHSMRYRIMAGVLAQVRADMAEATELKQVQEVARETERVMREENSDWFGVMRFHDMELIT